jgi:hypothetical protein
MNSELADAQWALIKPHLPAPQKRGSPQAQGRQLYHQRHSVRAAHWPLLAGLLYQFDLTEPCMTVALDKLRKGSLIYDSIRWNRY